MVTVHGWLGCQHSGLLSDTAQGRTGEHVLPFSDFAAKVSTHAPCFEVCTTGPVRALGFLPTPLCMHLVRKCAWIEQ